MLRTILAMILALSVAFGPVGVTLAFATGGGAQTAHLDMLGADNASVLADAGSSMVDCDQVAQPASSSECHCCDKSSKCPDQASCLTKCCAKVLGSLKTLTKTGVPRLVHFRPADPLRPPDWTIAPPAPPPRT